MKLIRVLFFVILSFSAFADNSNQFESVTAGFTVTKPKDWQFVTAEENRENIKNVKLKDDEFKKFMLKHSTAPLVAMMKHPEPFDDLNPSFKVHIKPFGQRNNNDEAMKILEQIIPRFQKIFQDFKLKQAPMETKVGGLSAAYMRINYTLVIPDDKTFPVTSELWVVPRGDYFFMIGAGTRQDEKTGTRSEISKILSSIKL